MRKILVLALVFFGISLSSNAQNSIVGKWKPVSFSLEGILKGDLSKEKADITVSIDSLVKNHDDPKTSKMMTEMIFQLLFYKFKVTEEEYTQDGKYKEIDIESKRVKTGFYTINTDKQTLERKPTSYAELEKFTFIIASNKLVMKTKVGSNKDKQSDLEIVYERM